MKYRRLGQAGMKVSKLFGEMNDDATLARIDAVTQPVAE